MVKNLEGIRDQYQQALLRMKQSEARRQEIAKGKSWQQLLKDEAWLEESAVDRACATEIRSLELELLRKTFGELSPHSYNRYGIRNGK